MKFEHKIDISVEPSVVFAAYKDVSNWPQWDPETESASIDGSFLVGTIGKIKPKGEPETKMKLVEVTENRSFTVECPLPLCKMYFIHLTNANTDGTELVNRVEFSGMLGPIFRRLIGKQINESIPGSLKALKNHLESQS